MRSPLFPGVLGLVLLGLPSLSAEPVPGQPVPAQSVVVESLEGKVRALFEESCASCHDAAQRPKPKGDFGHILDLPRLARDRDFIVAGFPERSELYRYMTSTDEEEVMPPVKSEAHRPTVEEIKLVADWITSLPTTAPPVAAPAPVAIVKTAPPAPKVPPGPLTIFARTHVMMVHFPVALLLLAALVDWLALPLRRTAPWLPVVRWCLGAAALSALFAVLAGWLLAGVEGIKPETVFLHRWLGVATAVTAWLAWGLLEFAERTDRPRVRMAARVFLGIAAVLVAIAGHTGGELVYGAGYPFN